MEIELLDGTKVLNVSYVNENKDLLIPVLKEISEQYQDYSKDSKLKIENQLIYLNSQIDKYLEKVKHLLKCTNFRN